ncbi:MAG: hypothetical protein S4CHLAM102_04940 [Chlamydiia bacterium]|nr:hypothetical protein [Chlamydiia bacterium]
MKIFSLKWICFFALLNISLHAKVLLPQQILHNLDEYLLRSETMTSDELLHEFYYFFTNYHVADAEKDQFLDFVLENPGKLSMDTQRMIGVCGRVYDNEKALTCHVMSLFRYELRANLQNTNSLSITGYGVLQDLLTQNEPLDTAAKTRRVLAQAWEACRTKYLLIHEDDYIPEIALLSNKELAVRTSQIINKFALYDPKAPFIGSTGLCSFDQESNCYVAGNLTFELPPGAELLYNEEGISTGIIRITPSITLMVNHAQLDWTNDTSFHEWITGRDIYILLDDYRKPLKMDENLYEGDRSGAYNRITSYPSRPNAPDFAIKIGFLTESGQYEFTLYGPVKASEEMYEVCETLYDSVMKFNEHTF